MNPPDAPNLLKSRVQKIKQYSENKKFDIDKVLMGFCAQNREIDKLVFGINNMEQLKRNMKISERPHYNLDNEFIEFMASGDENMLLPFNWKEDDWLEKLEK